MDESLKAWIAQQPNVYMVGDTPWKLESQILSPVNPPHTDFYVDKSELKNTINESGALLARWYTNWDRSESEWWFTCCRDRQLTIESIRSARGRRGVRKGLKNVEIKRIPADMFAVQSYDIYIDALVSYGAGQHELVSLEQYQADCTKDATYKGSEYWGAYLEDQLIAYSACFVIDDAVLLGKTKSNREFHKLNPNNALFFEICRHYLVDKNHKYVTNGVRTILHGTNINEFLLNINFERVYCDLNVMLSRKANIVRRSGVQHWGSAVIPSIRPNIWNRLDGFFKLLRFATTVQ